MKIKKIDFDFFEKNEVKVQTLRGSCDPPMGATTWTFRLLLEVVEHYVQVKCEGQRCKGSGDIRGQSFNFDLEYLRK